MPYTPNLPSICVNTTSTGAIVLSTTTTVAATFPVTVKGLWLTGGSTAIGVVQLIDGTSAGTIRIKVHTGLNIGGYMDLGNGVVFNTAIYAEVAAASKSATIVYQSG